MTLTYEEFVEAVLHGWTNCMPAAHFDAPVAWAWLCDPDRPPLGKDAVDEEYAAEAREGWVLV